MEKHRRLFRIIIISIIVIIGVPLILTIALITQACLQPWHLPAPTGQNRVGLIDLAVVDSTRNDPYTNNTSVKRELLLRIFYPASPLPGAKPIGYVQLTPGGLEQMARMLSLPVFLFAPTRHVTSYIFVNAPAAVQEKSYPVILFSHGIGLGTAGQNSVQFCELASHGYVVVSIGHTYESGIVSFPDGRTVTADMARWKRVLHELAPENLNPLIKATLAARTLSQQDSVTLAYVKNLPILDTSHNIWTDDTRFVIRELDRLYQKADPSSVLHFLDLSRIGIFGHSLGGMTAQKCIIDEGRLSAGISYDPGPVRENVLDSIEKPFMFLQAGPNRFSSEPAFARCRTDAYYGVINSARHFDFSDLCLWFSGKPFWKLMGFTGVANGHRCEEILNACTLTFFDKYLKNNNVDVPGAVKAFPEIKLKTNFHR